ncbi:hypothetical protein TNCV_1278011 [Trichonephila clavipes]|nr:hypothetical protein TNCV_1278011 [Trichonephila clavipes]
MTGPHSDILGKFLPELLDSARYRFLSVPLVPARWSPAFSISVRNTDDRLNDGLAWNQYWPRFTFPVWIISSGGK